MIINIPLQIDDAAFEGKLTAEYETKVINHIEERIDSVLKDHDQRSWGYSRTARGGLDNLISYEINERITDFLNENREEIIAAAAKDLGNRLMRSKRGKEILEEVSK